MADFYGNFAGEGQVAQAIGELFQEGYLVDPHTAVAYSVYKEYRQESGDDKKVLLASTASPFKFGRKVAESIGLKSYQDEFECLQAISEAGKIEIPKSIRDLKEKPIRHNTLVERDQMKEAIKEFLRLGDLND